MVSIYILAKARAYILQSFKYTDTDKHIEIHLDVQNIDNVGRTWLLECDPQVKTLYHKFTSSLLNDTIVYSCGPREKEKDIIKYIIRIIQPNTHNYGQNTQDAFVVLLDEEGKAIWENTLYFFDIENPNNSSCSYLGNTLTNGVYLH